HMANVLGVSADSLDVDSDFTSLGIDSLSGAQITARLNEAFDVKLDQSELYDYPTIRALARRLGETEDMVEATAINIGAGPARADDPVAIVGLACRFPGCSDVAGYWRLLAEGRSGIVSMPADRLAIGELVGASKDRPIGWRGGFVGGIDRFDAAFF